MSAAKNLLALCLFCLLTAALGGCDQLGIETADKVAARQEGEGKAIGGACRYAGRALEDCYQMNKRASKAAVYAGWRDMDAYMRENSIAVVKPAGEEDAPAAAPKAATAATAAAESADHKKPVEAKAEQPSAEKLSGAANGEKPAKALTKTS